MEAYFANRTELQPSRECPRPNSTILVVTQNPVLVLVLPLPTYVYRAHLRHRRFVVFGDTDALAPVSARVRLPSLHKMSMMSHRVKIMPYSTFRLNLSVTPPYNADFDGDEMNMHIPPSEETRAELSQIAWVPRQIISPQANKPVMGIVQDTLCGIRKLTLRDTFLDWNFVQNILLWVPGWDGQVPVPTILKPKPLWTGKQILSMCIPSGINVTRAPEKDKNSKRVPFNPVADDGICIENGQIIFEVVEKKTVGASQAGLIPIVFRGLTPQEFFFHAIAGREGLIDTAVKTAETGYIQRRLVKAMEDIAVCYDGTVRNSLGDIVQFSYGEDGMDGAFIERQSVEPYWLSRRAFDREYRVDVLETGSGFSPNTFQVGIDGTSPELQYKLDREFAQLTEDRRLLREFPHYLPFNLRRIIENAQQIFHIDKRKPSDLEPSERPDQYRSTSQRDHAVQHASPVYVRDTASLEELHLNRQAFDWIIGEVETKFNASIVNPGEMCGTLAAQSIGEPATQMTLNTFHYAGVSSKNVTLGVPRLKEIINVATNIKTPLLTVHARPVLEELHLTRQAFD
ncbi:DNA-directed RNA polymerase II subunit rpb1 [Ceratobasidium sp. 370]|nr:DNA-directed RNA polymerase II subunit rpb1 [Ceratobasidium sp. 370]